MQIVEIKNNLVKISYDTAQENLILSGFLVIKDEDQVQGLSFISQIMHLEATVKGNFAIAKLIFNFDSTGVVTNYNGSIPRVSALVEEISSQEVLYLMPVKNPVVLGELAQQDVVLKLDKNLFEDNLLVCSEKEANNQILIKNIHAQLSHSGKKLLIFDFDGGLEFSSNKIVAGEDFRLPLNYETINFIYERGLDDANAESKALIQEVFLEVQKYVKTLESKFIPFDAFKSVVDEQYKELGLVELVLLKNKLLKYKEAGVFAQDKREFLSLENSLSKNEATIFDLSKMDEKIQREMISYAYSLLQDGVYVVVNMSNKNSDKKLLKQMFMSKTVYTTVICPYTYKYLNEIKQLSRNLILFTPLQPQNDFASYNIFLNKLNHNEFVVCGTVTNHVPLIVKLSDIPQSTFEEAPEIEEEVQVSTVYTAPEEPINAQEPTREELLDEQIRRDVDRFYTTPKIQEAEEADEVEEIPIIAEAQEYASAIEEGVDEALTEDDLDFLDDMNIVEAIPTQEEQEFEKAEEVEEIPSLPQDSSLEWRKEEPTVHYEEETTQQTQTFAEELNTQSAPDAEILPASAAAAPAVPIYSADVEPLEGEIGDFDTNFEQGDSVEHVKYGKGVVEKLISYGSKTLCSINFDNVGRRLLDPSLSGLKKV